MTATRPGRCLCGAVSFETTGDPKWTAWCHCQSCRRHSGAPASAYAGFEKLNVRWSGEPAWFVSSPGVRRGFCATCGSTLAYEGDRWPTETHLHVGGFDDPSDLAPKGEVFAEERLPWFHSGLKPTS